jgi:hypothetical protein
MSVNLDFPVSAMKVLYPWKTLRPKQIKMVVHPTCYLHFPPKRPIKSWRYGSSSIALA